MTVDPLVSVPFPPKLCQVTTKSPAEVADTSAYT
jgi:hypothetical protein